MHDHEDSVYARAELAACWPQYRPVIMNKRNTRKERRAEHEAIDWLVECDGEPTADQMKGLAKWLGERPENREAYNRIKKFGQDLNALRVLDTGEVDLEVVKPWAGSRPLHRWVQPLALAAAVGAIGLFIWITAPDVYENQYHSNVGERLEVVLPDLSTVTLNTNSRINVRYDTNERWVHLEKGEAHFVVEAAPDRPFNVFAGSGTVRAVGTAFNVYVKQDVVEVTVAEGVVEVVPTSVDEFEQAIQEEHQSATDPMAETLVGGQTAEYSQTVEVISSVPPEDLDGPFTYWRDGILEFEDERLDAVVEEASRYFTAKISIESPELAASHITAVFEAGSADIFLRLIDQSNEMRVRSTSQGHFLIVPARATHPNDW